MVDSFKGQASSRKQYNEQGRDKRMYRLQMRNDKEQSKKND